jgi:hypothetical protein
MRLVTILSFILCSIVLYGQSSNYEIFDVQNFVQVKTRGAEQWNIAKKGNAIGLIDSIKINTNGKIRILDIRTNEIYRSDKPGNYRVKDIRDAAQEQSSKMFAAVCAQIKKDDTGHHSDMNMVGATTRGEYQDATEAIAQTIAYIGKQLTNNTVKYTQDLTLKTHVSGEEIYFSISNSSTKSYCVNVVLYNKESKKASLCYVINPAQSDTPYILLPANRTLELPMWRFTTPSPQEAYILFATEQSYDSYHLQHILQNLNWGTISEPAYQAYKIAK